MHTCSIQVTESVSCHFPSTALGLTACCIQQTAVMQHSNNNLASVDIQAAVTSNAASHKFTRPIADVVCMQVKGLFSQLKVEYTAIELDEVGKPLAPQILQDGLHVLTFISDCSDALAALVAT